MVSKTKIIRDIIIIVIIVTVGVVIWQIFLKPNNKSSPDVSEMMNSMKDMPAVEGDGTEFEIDNPEIAIKVNGREYSIGEIDQRAMTNFRMISMGKMGLTKELREESRRKAVLNMRREAVVEKAMKDFNIIVTDAEIESLLSEIKNSLTDQGSFDDFLKQMQVTEDLLKIRIRKDESENRLFLAFIQQKNLQDTETAAQQEAFTNWIDEQVQTLEFEVLGSFLKELTMPAPDGMNGSPHGMGSMPPVNPDADEKTSEGNPTDKQGN